MAAITQLFVTIVTIAIHLGDSTVVIFGITIYRDNRQ